MVRKKLSVTTKLDFAWSNGWSWFYGHKHRNHGQKKKKWASSKDCVDFILECERLCNLGGAQSRAAEESASKEVSWVTLGMSLVSLEYFLFGLFWICIIRRKHWESLTLDFVLIFFMKSLLLFVIGIEKLHHHCWDWLPINLSFTILYHQPATKLDFSHAKLFLIYGTAEIHTQVRKQTQNCLAASNIGQYLVAGGYTNTSRTPHPKERLYNKKKRRRQKGRATDDGTS